MFTLRQKYWFNLSRSLDEFACESIYMRNKISFYELVVNALPLVCALSPKRSEGTVTITHGSVIYTRLCLRLSSYCFELVYLLCRPSFLASCENVRLIRCYCRLFRTSNGTGTSPNIKLELWKTRSWIIAVHFGNLYWRNSWFGEVQIEREFCSVI